MYSGKNTELAVLDVLYIIEYQLDQGVTYVTIYIDLSNIFDTVDHDTLLIKL